MEFRPQIGVAHSVHFPHLTPQPVTVTATQTNAGAPGISSPQMPPDRATTLNRLIDAFDHLGVPWTGSFEITFDPIPDLDTAHGYELAIAVAIARASRLAPSDGGANSILRFFGRLASDGSVLAAHSTTAAVTLSSRLRDTGIVVAAPCTADTTAALHCAANLRDALRAARHATDTPGTAPLVVPDMAEIRGLASARRAMEVAAAGGHHMLMIGASGSGATMLAERLPSILPPLTQRQADEVDDIHCLAGIAGTRPRIHPPYAAPHFSSTMAAMIGASTPIPRPGALSLAHHGVLFLEQAPEFRRDVIDALRQPLEHRELIIAVARATRHLPANLHLVATTRWCPVDHDRRSCDCGPAKRTYLARLSTVMRHVPIRITLPDPPDTAEAVRQPLAESSAVVRTRVIAARARSAARWGAQAPGTTNQSVSVAVLNSLENRLDADAAAPLDAVTDPRIFQRRRTDIIRVAWTIADLADAAAPGREHVVEAMGLCLIEGGVQS